MHEDNESAFSLSSSRSVFDGAITVLFGDRRKDRNLGDISQDWDKLPTVEGTVSTLSFSNLR